MSSDTNINRSAFMAIKKIMAEEGKSTVREAAVVYSARNNVTVRAAEQRYYKGRSLYQQSAAKARQEKEAHTNGNGNVTVSSGTEVIAVDYVENGARDGDDLTQLAVGVDALVMDYRAAIVAVGYYETEVERLTAEVERLTAENENLTAQQDELLSAIRTVMG